MKRELRYGFVGAVLAAAAAAQEPVALEWPREYSNEEGAKAIVYQPQITSWDDMERVEARAALAFSLPDAEAPSFGTFEMAGNTEVELEDRLVKISDIEISNHNFPSLDEAQSAKLRAKLDELLPKDEIVASLDRLQANLERGRTSGRGVETKTLPPKIFVSNSAAILVMLDGKPIWSEIEGNELEFAVNTNWDLFKHPPTGKHYLRVGDFWISTSKLGGRWEPAGKLPKAFKKLDKKDENWNEVRASQPGRKIEQREVPKVYVSEAPAELIVIDGEASLAIVEGTKLLWVTNTESDLFLHSGESRFYYLVSGRWFRAENLAGPWRFGSHDLPDDFERIPEDHPAADVRASVPGTPEAEEAIALARIPQTAKVERDKVSAEVAYVGEPEFEPIEGTSMYHAVNTSSDVIRVGDLYYLCYQAVWFASSSPQGPWEVTDAIPDEIYTIPPSSPVYNVTYVRVYDHDPSWVTFGYTSGYWGVYYSYGCMVYGTGWYYSPYSYYGSYYPYPVYWGYPYSYGVGAYYNPYTGTYGRGAVAYGPYGGFGAATAYNPRTGTYARGAAAYGPYNARGWAEAYNPRTGTYARTRQGANAYSNWGTTGVRRGNDWARGAHYTDSRGTVGGVKTSRGGAAIGARGQEGSGGLARTGGGDLFAGKDGQVYKRGDDGWKKYDGGNWKPVDRGGERPSAAGTGSRSRPADRGTIDQLNRDYAGRAKGAQRSGQYGSWRSSGTSRPTRGSYGGGRGGMSRGGGRRR